MGLGKASWSGWLNTLQAFGKVVTAILLVLFGFGVWGAVFGNVLGYLVATLVGLFFGFSTIKYLVSGSTGSSNVLSFGVLKSMILYGFPLYLSVIVVTVTNQYNYVVLARFVSDAEIGGFMVALNVTAIITLFVVPVSTVLFPAFSRVEASDRDFLPRVFELAVRYSVLLIVPVSIFVSIYSNELVLLLYGPGFVHAGEYLGLYAVLYVVFPLGLVVRSFLMVLVCRGRRF